MQQKQFRIEKLLAGQDGFETAEAESGALTAFKRNLASLVADEDGRRLTRAAAELGAAVESMEKATQTVLAAAESIDDGTRSMACGHASGAGCEIAPDIQQRIAQIYEACNFQDLAGQRIGKVISLLAHLEDQLARAAADGGVAPAGAAERRDAGLINGPRLDGATGHVDQSDIDRLFG